MIVPLLALFEFNEWAVIAIIALIGATGASWGTRQRIDVRRLERKLDALLKHHGIEDTSGLSEEVRQLARDPKNKIAAIKLHRQQTGVGLAEAKSDIEAFMESGK